MGQILNADCTYTFKGALHFTVNKMSLIKQKIKGCWADPNPHGWTTAIKGEHCFCFKTTASIHQKGAVEWPELLGELQPLHLSEALVFPWPWPPRYQSLYCLHCDCGPPIGSLDISKSGISLPKFSLSWVLLFVFVNKNKQGMSHPDLTSLL